MALIPLRNRLKETVKFSSFIGSFVGLIGGMITTGIVAGITGIPFIGLPTIASAVGTSYGLTKLAIVLGIIFGSAFTGGLVVFASCLVIAALIGVGYGVFQHFAATNNEEMNEEIPVVVIGLEDGRDVADVAAEENVEPAIEPLPEAEPELEPESESKPQEQVQAMKEEEPVSSASSQEPPSSPSTAGSENSASDDESSQSEKEEDLQPPPEKVSDDVPHTDIPEQPQPTSSPAVIMQALGVQLSSPSPQVASTAVVVETSVPSATTHEPEPEPVLDPMFDPRYQEQNWSLIM